MCFSFGLEHVWGEVAVGQGGAEPTIVDAHLLLGHLAADRTRFRQVLAKLRACWWVSLGPGPGPGPPAGPAGQRPAAAA